MITKKCLVCGKEFKTTIYAVKKENGKFCCRKCYSETLKGKPSWNKGKKMFNFPQCGFQKGHPAFCIKHTKKTLEKISGKNSIHWKGGKMKERGYIYIYQPLHPFATFHKYVFEHRLIAEKCLKRYLTLKERIHHINEIKDDNRPENLYLFATTNLHSKFHKNPCPLTSNLL